MVKQEIQELMRTIPSMDKLLEKLAEDPIAKTMDREIIKGICRKELDTLRRKIADGELKKIDIQTCLGRIKSEIERRSKPSLRSVINATGVVIHTNLGRSRLCKEALEAVSQCAANYCTLEYDLTMGSRGHRNSHVEWLLCQLTGAQAALVVNNNASAVLLCLAALARSKEAIVSRGELVEIGGSFRIPDIMKFAGTKLVEVGCTNRTHLKDFQEAITQDTTMLMKVHRSNFRMTGFTAEVDRKDLASLAKENDLILMEDLGSGILVNAEAIGLFDEPTVASCLADGVDVVTFSGDKLLGGPQIGAIVGKSAHIDLLKKHQLLRAMRCDKMTLAAMEATLRVYLEGRIKDIPTLGMIAKTLEELREEGSTMLNLAKKELSDLPLEIALTSSEDAVGGGSYPERPLPGIAVSIKLTEPFASEKNISAGTIQTHLRTSDTPSVVGAKDDSILLHVRTLNLEEAHIILKNVKAYLETKL